MVLGRHGKIDEAYNGNCLVGNPILRPQCTQARSQVVLLLSTANWPGESKDREFKGEIPWSKPMGVRPRSSAAPGDT